MGEQVAQLAEGGADWFHVDLIDGHYVSNLGFPARLIGELKTEYPHIAVDVHVMVTDPAAYVDQLAALGTDYMTFHMDATPFALRMIKAIHDKGMKAGVAINPSHRIDALVPVLPELDMVVLMTVEPGFPAQTFLPCSLPRLKELIALREAMGLSFLISIDGSVDMENAKACAELGAEVFVTGAYTVFHQDVGIAEACRRFVRLTTPE